MDEDVVYILTNPCMSGLVKIGRSTVAGFQGRLNSLSSHSGIPMPFMPYYVAVVKDAKFVEERLHKTFAAQRLSPKREFFEIDPAHAQAALELATIRELFARAESEEEEEVEKFIRKRPKFQFSFANVPKGATLHFVRDESITCTVIDETTIEFEGEKTSLSTAASKILNARYGWKADAPVQGTIYWLYENETLDERRARLENAR